MTKLVAVAAAAVAVVAAANQVSNKVSKTNHQALVAADEKEEKTSQKENDPKLPPTETVRHLKEAGTGYSPNSPLYQKQQAALGRFTSKTMPPLSTTLQCVINLTLQYFICYTALAVARTAKVSGYVTTTLSSCCQTVSFAAILSILFVAVRMRAVQLAQGDTEKYALPPMYAQSGMQIATWAVLMQILLVLVLAVVEGRAPPTDTEGNLVLEDDDVVITAKRSPGKTAIAVLRTLSMLMLYGGVTAVVVGSVIMTGPKEIWGDEQPPVSPALAATIALADVYFVVYVGHAFVKSVWPKSTWVDVWAVATTIVSLSPMLCVLFLAARMRALQLDRLHGNPQPWAQNMFYICAGAVGAQVIIALLTPFIIPGATLKRGEFDGDVTFLNVSHPTIMAILQISRWACTLCIYGGFTAVIVSMFTIEHPTKGPDHTPAVAPAVQCIMLLASQFLLVYLGLFILATLKALGTEVKFATATLEAARGTVVFCPMVCVLFLGARMRALQLTSNTGAPPAWAQECMFLTTYAIEVQMILCCSLPFLTGKTPEADEDGNIKSPSGGGAVAKVVEAVRYASMAAMYGGAIGVITAVAQMTPENANGSGSSLFPGFEVPVPGSAVPPVAALPAVPNVL